MEKVNFSKYNDKYFLCIEEGVLGHKVIIYHLIIEKDWWKGTDYQPILYLYGCDLFGGDCIVHKKEIAQSKFLPEFNTNVKEIDKELFNQLKAQIENLSVEETALKSNKLNFYLECKKQWW